MRVYTDSKVVLGYIFNETKRFDIYVHNRVQRIRHSTQPHQWNFVPTHLNPADAASRGLPSEQLTSSFWFTGPPFLLGAGQDELEKRPYILVSPETDAELRPECVTCVTNLSQRNLGSERFQRFSRRSSLLKTVARLQHIAKSFKPGSEGICRGWHICSQHKEEEQLKQARDTIIQTVQREVYRDDFKRLEQGQSVQKSSPLSKLCPFIDTEGLLRVGG